MKQRCYEIQLHGNQDKQEELRNLIGLWRSALVTVQLIQVRRLQAGKRIGWLKKEDLGVCGSPLSARQLKSVTNQVNAALKSWEKLAKKTFRTLCAGVDDKLKKDVRDINNTARWWSKETEFIVGESEFSVSQDALDYSSDLMKEVLKVCPFPNLGYVKTALLDSTLFTAEEAKTSTGFDKWLTVSSTVKRKPVVIPFTTSKFYDSREGVEAGVIQLQLKSDGRVAVYRVKKSAEAKPRETGEVIGMDWGLSCLFTTSDGRRLGQNFLVKLKRYDTQIRELEKALSKNKLTPKQSKRWRKLNHRIREFTKNEVNRVINKLVADGVSEIVVESLDFRSSQMGNTMNRILNRSGRGAVKAKLSAVTEDHGVAVTEVNPAYTSQECLGCGYVSEKNRPTQKLHRCKFCGKKSHADVNASRVIRQRRSRTNGLRYLGRGAILMILDRNFQTKWSVNPAVFRQRQAAGSSTGSSAKHRRK